METLVPNQTELLFPPGWGGKRKGAGRKPGRRRAGVRHRSRDTVSWTTPVSMTCKMLAGMPSLRTCEAHAIITGAFREAYLRRAFLVTQYSVQHTHLHIVVEARDAEQLSRGMGRILIRITRRLNKLWGRTGSLWPERYHSRVIKHPRAMRFVLRYVINNARKHGAWGKQDEPDPYSSGAWFDGWSDLALAAVSIAVPSHTASVTFLHLCPAAGVRATPRFYSGQRWRKVTDAVWDRTASETAAG